MWKGMVLFGALLGGAPLFSQAPQAAEPQVVNGQLAWFRLTENKEEVARMLGLPKLVADFGADLQAWQYRDEAVEHDDFSRSLIFRRSTGVLVSVTRTYPESRDVDGLFPEAETRTYCQAAVSGPEFCVRVRRLPDGRLLLANGVARPGQRSSQLLLIRETDVGAFYPWLAEQRKRAPSK